MRAIEITGRSIARAEWHSPDPFEAMVSAMQQSGQGNEYDKLIGEQNDSSDGM
jgi:hypothetical protein